MFDFSNKIRNIWSDGNNLKISYKKGDVRYYSTIEDFPWYFVVSTEDYTNNPVFKELQEGGLIQNVEHQDFGYTKIYCKMMYGKRHSEAAAVIKILNESNIKHYEADLHSAKRFLIDNPVEISEEYDILYFDIETDDTERKIRVGGTRILSIGAIDNKGNRFYFDNKDERVLITNFLKILKNYDVLASWNGDEFDIPYIRGGIKYEGEGENRQKIEIVGRMQHLGMSKRLPSEWIGWKQICHIDLLKRARKVYKEDSSIKSYSLENICQHFLKKGKIKFKGKIVNLSKAKLKEYNMHDVELLKELDEKLGMVNMIGKMCAISKTLIYYFAGMFVGEVIDSMIIREAHLNNMYVPSNIKREKGSYVGAFVFEPVPGLYKDVVCFDFKSLYPSIISTFNIGFDTIESSIGNRLKSAFIVNPGTQIPFRRDQKSIVASAVEKLVEARQSYKKERLKLVNEGKMKGDDYETIKANENVVKELSNSVYGILGSQYHRYYSKPLAESITKTGQFLLQLSKKFFESRGLSVIYGDTDSIFVQWKSEKSIEEVMKEYHTKLDVILKERFNVKDNIVYLKYEKTFSSLIMLGKKYYVGKVTNIEGNAVDEQIVKGIDLVKKGTLKLTSQVQQGVINLIYDNKPISDIKYFLQRYQLLLAQKEFKFDELKIVKGVGEALGDYSPKSQNQPHIMAARKMIARDGYLETNTVEYVVVNKKLESDNEDKIALEDEFNGSFDRVYYWNEHLFAAAKRILEIVYPSVDWDKEYELKYPKKEKHLAKGQLTLI